MKRNRGIMLAGLFGALAIAGSAVAYPGMGCGQMGGNGGGMGCGPCGSMAGNGPGMGCGPMAANPEFAAKHKAFIKETLPLREKVMAKRLDLQKEYSEDKPDQAKLTKLQSELVELQKKMWDARTKAGLSCGPMAGKGKRGYAGPGNGCGPCR